MYMHVYQHCIVFIALFSTLLGPKADHFAFEECLESVGAYGKAEHIMVCTRRIV